MNGYLRINQKTEIPTETFRVTETFCMYTKVLSTFQRTLSTYLLYVADCLLKLTSELFYFISKLFQYIRISFQADICYEDNISKVTMATIIASSSLAVQREPTPMETYYSGRHIKSRLVGASLSDIKKIAPLLLYATNIFFFNLFNLTIFLCYITIQHTIHCMNSTNSKNTHIDVY